MIELLLLFWTFFKIGLFTFGGGYAMIPLMESELVDGGYIQPGLFYDLVGIGESSPGPLAVNLSTLIGYNHYGYLGAFVATIGVILPSFIIIFLLAKYGSKLLETQAVKDIFKGLNSAVIGLILSVGVGLLINAFLPLINLNTGVFDFSTIEWAGIIIFGLLLIFIYFYRDASPVLVILIAALLGIILYGVI